MPCVSNEHDVVKLQYQACTVLNCRFFWRTTWRTPRRFALVTSFSLGMQRCLDASSCWRWLPCHTSFSERLHKKRPAATCLRLPGTVWWTGSAQNPLPRYLRTMTGSGESLFPMNVRASNSSVLRAVRGLARSAPLERATTSLGSLDQADRTQSGLLSIQVISCRFHLPLRVLRTCAASKVECRSNPITASWALQKRLVPIYYPLEALCAIRIQHTTIIVLHHARIRFW